MQGSSELSQAFLAAGRAAGTRRQIAAILAAFSLIFILLRTHALSQESSTFDEPLHLTAGYSALRGDHRVDPSHPPLINMWAALPLLAMGAELDLTELDYIPPPIWPRHSYEFAHRFLYAANDADQLLHAARAMIAVWGLVLGILIFFWAYEWVGFIPAILALGFYTLEPNLAAHGTLVTADFAVACFVFAAVYFLWRSCRRLTTLNLTGVLLGSSLAVVSKFSGLVLVPVLAALLALSLATARLTVRRAAGMAGLIAVAILVGIWAAYGFRYAPSDSQWWVYRIDVGATQNRDLDSVTSVARLIDRQHFLPNAFTYGLFTGGVFSRHQQSLTTTGAHSVGRSRYYWPLVVLIKTPIAMLTLLIAGVWLALRRRGGRPDSSAAFIFLPVVGFLALTGMNHNNTVVRHLLPIFPFLILLAAWTAKELLTRERWGSHLALTLICVVWLGEYGFAHPHTLAFANHLVGGPAQAFHYLGDSDLDWGQDLKPLKRWMDNHGVGHINLAYFGSADPAYYRIDCTYLPGSPPFAAAAVSRPRLPGYVAVSATILSGVYLQRRWRLHYAPLRYRKPQADIGGSIKIYWLEQWPDPSELTGDDSDIDLLRRLADSLLAQGWFSRAARYYERYLIRRPTNVDALGNFGATLMALGRQGEAIAAYRRAVTELPHDVRSRQNLTIALLEAGLPEEALATAREAVRIAPDDPLARALMSRTTAVLAGIR